MEKGNTGGKQFQPEWVQLEMIDEYTVGGKEDEGPVVEGYKRFSLTG
jgi:hypothetical protein